jgi:5-methyltetrahydrofolate--homocysteine methyltransferase
LRDDFIAKTKADYVDVRERHAAQRGEAKRVTLEEARANGLKTDWSAYTPPVPKTMGLQVFKNYDLAELAAIIDWTPFFQAWELHGRYPKILQDDVVGEEARKLFADAQAMLGRLIRENWIEARAVVGLFPANRIEDDIAIYADEQRERQLMVWHNLRQQMQKPATQPNACLADYVAPAPVKDYIGAFVVTAGIREDEKVKAFEAANDDYSAILFKALCDRLAEAFAERMHQRIRTEYWGYAGEESLTSEQLIAEDYRGIRPAPGYPACPEHSEKGALFDLLNVSDNIGVTLTESYAMLPMASVSGFYFSHPDSRYFAVARIGRDQVEDYARRKGWDLAEAEKWLAPNLGYTPE